MGMKEKGWVVKLSENRYVMDEEGGFVVYSTEDRAKSEYPECGLMEVNVFVKELNEPNLP